MLAVLVGSLFLMNMPQENQANRRVLMKLKKIAALSILLKPKKLLALPLPLPLPLPIPVIKTTKPEPYPVPSWPQHNSWGGDMGGMDMGGMGGGW